MTNVSAVKSPPQVYPATFGRNAAGAIAATSGVPHRPAPGRPANRRARKAAH